MGRLASAPRPLSTDRELKDRAHALVLKGKLDQAIEVYRGLLVANARDATIRLRHAELCRKVGRVDEAVASYLATAQLLEKEGHASRARAVLTCALQLAPGEPTLLAPLRRLNDELRQTPPKFRPSPALALVPPPVASAPQGEQLFEPDFAFPPAPPRRRAPPPPPPPSKKLPPHAATTPAQPRLRLAYSVDDEICEAPTDPYCPLFDWLEEAPRYPVAPKRARRVNVPAARRR